MMTLDIKILSAMIDFVQIHNNDKNKCHGLYRTGF